MHVNLGRESNMLSLFFLTLGWIDDLSHFILNYDTTKSQRLLYRKCTNIHSMFSGCMNSEMSE